MARKKQEIALQTELETQDEWDEMLAKDGLTGMYCTFVILFLVQIQLLVE